MTKTAELMFCTFFALILFGCKFTHTGVPYTQHIVQENSAATNGLTTIPHPGHLLATNGIINAKQIESDLRNRCKVRYETIIHNLGEPSEVESEGSVPHLLWYYQDGSCFVVSLRSLRNTSCQWIECKPGEFDLSMIYKAVSARLKTRIITGMNAWELVQLLGPGYGDDIQTAGTAYWLWYFDDGTCLVATRDYIVNRNVLNFGEPDYIACPLGCFRMDMLRKESQLRISPFENDR